MTNAITTGLAGSAKLNKYGNNSLSTMKSKLNKVNYVLFYTTFKLNYKRMKTFKYLSIIALMVPFASCHKIEQLPPEPKIEFTSFAVFDTVDILGNDAKGGRLKFYFEDGDGDLGLQSPDLGQTDTTNLFFTLFKKSGGIMVPASDNDPLRPSPYRIPYIDRPGQNKILKGTISVTFFYLFYSENDTIRYDFYVKDRANNESNTASTSEIELSVNGLYVK